MSRVGDLDEGHVRSRREQFALGRCEADVVLLTEDDPRPDARVAETLRERAVAIEIRKVGAGLSAEEARIVFFNSFNRNSRRAGGKLLPKAGPINFIMSAYGRCPKTRLRRSSARGKIDSSLREKLGESSTTGPENSPADTISRATFAPKLCPTTTSHERSAARWDAELE